MKKIQHKNKPLHLTDYYLFSDPNFSKKLIPCLHTLLEYRLVFSRAFLFGACLLLSAQANAADSALASIDQVKYNTANSSLPQVSSDATLDNRLSVSISGADNSISGAQTGAAQSTNIELNGNGSSVTMSGDGFANTTSMSVMGDANLVSQTQIGTNNSAELKIVGDGNTVTQSQVGDSLSYKLQINGSGNNVSVSQTQ